MPFIPFVRQSTSGYAADMAGGRLRNMFSEAPTDSSTTPLVQIPSAGLTLWATTGPGPVRAWVKQDGALYVLAGGSLWRITTGGVATELASVPDDAASTMAGNGVEIGIAAQGAFYLWNGTEMAEIAIGALTKVGSVASTAGYFIAFEADDPAVTGDGATFAISGIRDGTYWNAADFATAETIPDRLVRGIADHGELWLFGTDSLELWANTGAADFPFERYSGGVVENGLAWARAVCAADEGVWWVGGDRVVYRGATGASPQRVSNSGVERVLKAVAIDADVRMLSWIESGHKMVGIRFADRPAWVLDVSTGLWHERSSGIGERAWAGLTAIQFGGRQLIGGGSGRIWEVGGLTDDGETIERWMESLTVDAGGRLFGLGRVQLQFAQGRTNFPDPRIMTRWSRDGGNTWDAERQHRLGALGQYGYEVWLNGMARARRHNLRIRITDPIDAPLLGVSFEAKP